MSRSVIYLGSERHPVILRPRWQRLLRMEEPLTLSEGLALLAGTVFLALALGGGIWLAREMRAVARTEAARVAYADPALWRESK